MQADPPVPTFILQSDGLFREGLRLMLAKTRFRPQSCGVELDDLTAIPSEGPSLFIVGVGQEQDSICATIRAKYPRSLIIAIGDEVHRGNIRNALDDGANAALLSTVSPDALISALHSVVNTRLLVIDSRLWSLECQPKPDEPKSGEQAPQEQASQEQASQSLQERSPSIHDVPAGAADSDLHMLEPLTAREIAILERIVRGDSNKHIARFFNIAEPTVKAHVKAIFRKIGAGNRTLAAIWALKHRLFDGNAPQELSAALQHATDGDGFLPDRRSSPSKPGGNGVLKNGRSATSRLS
jgi:two-component system, NarL family, nitrate/nitrite response regulator NarL